MAAGSDQGRQPAHRAASPPSAGGGVGSRSLNPEPDSSQSGEQAMKVETISYEADGLAMESLIYLDEDKAGPRPGVLVFPEAFRSEERRVGKECVRPCRSRGAPRRKKK